MRTWVACMLALLVVVGCREEDPALVAGTAAEVLESARALAARDPQFAARLHRGASDLQVSAEGVDGPGIDRGGLFARIGDNADAPIAVGATAGLEERVNVWTEGAAPREIELVDGVAIYRDAFPSTDAIVIADERRLEVFYRLADEAAPTIWRWRLGRAPGLTARAEGDHVVLADGRGAARLRISAPGAVDAEGVHFAVTTELVSSALEGDIVRFALVVPDGARPRYPVLVDPLIDTVEWVRLEPATSPPAVWGHAMADDSTRQRIVLFGEGADDVGETWEWDGDTWAQRTPSLSPPRRNGHALAYDEARQRVVLFGGGGAGGALDDTWEWDGESWLERLPVARPPARSGHAMAYDAARQRVVLFGGYGGGLLDDTWEWDGETWALRSPPVHPSARGEHAMVYDAARERVMLFGGGQRRGDDGIPSDETWEWDGTTWTVRAPASSPPGRRGTAMAYDAARERVVLFGGWKTESYSDHEYHEDTWEWDSVDWVERAPGLGPAGTYARRAMAYDVVHQRVLLFGGDSPPQTWTLVSTRLAGSSCTSSPQCDSGHCVDGVCCDVACDGQCEACDLAGLEGTCAPVTGAPRGDRAACASDASVCGGACDGATRDRCVYSTVACRAAACTDAVATPAASCDGAGACPPITTDDCGPYRCDGDTCAATCAADEDCLSGHYCDDSVCLGLASDGADCDRGGECGSGHCVDGVCCESSCDGQCEACDVGGALGVCQPVIGAPHGARLACGSDGSACGGACDGSTGVACAYPGGDTSCGAASCAAGHAIAAASCDGAGACAEGASVACAPYACAGDVCATACDTAADCASDHHCDAGSCRPVAAVGVACTGDAHCASGHCVDGVCCESACAGQCEACNEPSSAGECVAVAGAPRGSRAACASADPACGGACDGLGRAACAYPAEETRCGEAVCEDEYARGRGECDGAGACGSGDAVSCAPFACREGACLESCEADADCADDLTCRGGTCAAAPPLADAGVVEMPPAAAGCGCRVPDGTRAHRGVLLFALGALLAWRRRRAAVR